MSKESVYDMSNVNWLREKFEKVQRWNSHNYKDINFVSYDNKGITLETFSHICNSTSSNNVLELSRIIADNSTERLELLVKKNPHILKVIPNPTPTMCKHAIEENINAIVYFKEEHYTPEICLLILQKNAKVFWKIPKSKQTKENCLLAVQEYPDNIVQIENPSEELQLLAVGKTPPLITEIKNPSEKVIIKALSTKSSQYCWDGTCKSFGHLIQYIPEELQTEAVCLVAVKCSPDAFRHVINKTEAICIEALKHYDVREHMMRGTLTDGMWESILSSNYLATLNTYKKSHAPHILHHQNPHHPTRNHRLPPHHHLPNLPPHPPSRELSSQLAVIGSQSQPAPTVLTNKA